MKGSFYIVRLIPNLITIFSIMSGLFSIYCALSMKWQEALFCYCASFFLDGIDGAVARWLKVSSSLGVELDSLADLTSFGIAPAIIWYLWMSAHCEHKLFLWFSSTFYVVCSAIRLAKFNLIAHNLCNIRYTFLSRYFFWGVPIPMGGVYVLLPLILSMVTTNNNVFIKVNEYFCFLYLICISVLLASKIPTFSLKAFRIPREYIWLVLIMFVLLLGLFVLYTWYFCCCFIFLYTLSIPVSGLFFLRFSRKVRP